jgi:hypothetical protein
MSLTAAVAKAMAGQGARRERREIYFTRIFESEILINDICNDKSSSVFAQRA